jgi:histidinol-phosphate phosphatase family protein
VIDDVRVILLDRDGVITEPVADPLTGTYESPLRPGDVGLVHAAPDALARLRQRGFILHVVSNQPAAAKGLVPLSELDAVHDRTVELLAQAGVVLDGWEYCFHHPEARIQSLSGPCDCRKPGNAMLLRALGAHNCLPDHAVMVGDADTDIAAGFSAGTRTALLEHPLTSHRRRPGAVPAPDVRSSNLLQFAELTLHRAELA